MGPATRRHRHADRRSLKSKSRTTSRASLKVTDDSIESDGQTWITKNVAGRRTVILRARQSQAMRTDRKLQTD